MGDWVRNWRRRMDQAPAAGERVFLCDCLSGSPTSDFSPKAQCIASAAILCAGRHRIEGKSDWSGWLRDLDRKTFSRRRFLAVATSTSGTERFDANEKATRQRGGLLFKGE